MNISWHGQSFFEIAVKGIEGIVKIAVDPFGEEIGLKCSKVEADILLMTHQHKDHNNIEAIKGQPFVIDSPGEYEFKGVSIQGISAFHDNQQGKDRGQVVIFKILAEDMSLCHMSDFGQAELTDEQLEQVGEVDILILPVASSHSLDAKGASHIISQIEPRVVIPMHYQLTGIDPKYQLETVDKFLKEMGAEDIKPEEKLKISQKDLPQEETKIIILQP